MKRRRDWEMAEMNGGRELDGHGERVGVVRGEDGRGVGSRERNVGVGEDVWKCELAGGVGGVLLGVECRRGRVLAVLEGVHGCSAGVRGLAAKVTVGTWGGRRAPCAGRCSGEDDVREGCGGRARTIDLSFAEQARTQ